MIYYDEEKRRRWSGFWLAMAGIVLVLIAAFALMASGCQTTRIFTEQRDTTSCELHGFNICREYE